MHVCHLVNSLEYGGAETHLLEMARANQQANTGLSLTVCSIEEAAPLAEEFRDLGVEVQNFGAAFKFDPRSIVRMERYFRQQEFDILHTHLPLSHALGRPLGRLTDIETIVSTQHNVADNYHPITGTLERLTRRLDTRTIAVSEGVRQSFDTNGQTWETIYNGLDVESYNEEVRAANLDRVREKWDIEDDIVFLNIARYEAEKSQSDLIETMARVTDQRKDVMLLLVGSGSLEDELRTKIRDENLEQHVKLTGHVPSVVEYYALADVFVSASVREGLPITLLEAMAAELPVVGTTIPGVDELVVDGETGYLVPPKAPKVLAERMLALSDSERQEAFGKAGFDRVRTQFDISKTLEAHIRLYRKLLHEDQSKDEI
ncbi:glycosyltransferase [Natronomonas amylolytica]|uniref:glycosyltransferase n=1 Tax=Natronomonas amylolytica TaxID=3108498 RepID=UPI00300B4111